MPTKELKHFGDFEKVKEHTYASTPEAKVRKKAIRDTPKNKLKSYSKRNDAEAKERKKAYDYEYARRPYVREKKRLCSQRRAARNGHKYDPVRSKEYNARPEVKERIRIWSQLPEVKERRRLARAETKTRNKKLKRERARYKLDSITYELLLNEAGIKKGSHTKEKL